MSRPRQDAGRARPRPLCNFPALPPISLLMEPATSCCTAFSLFLQLFGRLFSFPRRSPRPEDGHDRAARREAEWNRAVNFGEGGRCRLAGLDPGPRV